MLYLFRVLQFGHTAKALFTMCPRYSTRQSLRHTANTHSPVVPASLIYNYSYISWYTNWQTHCHLRGNFLCLGEERATKKGTEPLADTTARLLGMRGTAPRPRGSSGMLSSQAFFSHLLHRRLRGGSSWRTAPSALSPLGQPRHLGGDAKNSHPTWH